MQMKPCKNIRRTFVEALYGELNEEQRETFNNHLHSCIACRKSFARMKKALSVMSQRTRPQPGEEFWAGYWDQLEQRMARERKQKQVQTWQRWAYRAAAVILLIGAGVILGRISRTLPGTEQQVAEMPKAQVPVQQAKLEQRTQDFLGKSEILLLGIIHFDPAKQDQAAIDIPRQKKISGDLVHEASDLKKELSKNNDRRLEKLVGDLQLILIQIANLEEKEDLPEIEIVKSGVDREGILMKINMEQMRSRSASYKQSKSALGNTGI
jgi:hypothetical protein